MCKLLVTLPSGEQAIIDIDSTGEYYDPIRVLWDTRQRGEMPPVTLGKMQLVDNQLVTLDDFLPDHAAAIYAKSIPLEVPMTAAREALINNGLFDAVDQFIASQNQVDIMWWDKATTIYRGFPLVERARVALGLTHNQIDELFIAAEIIRKERSFEV
jgi:hypothetical protein